MFAEAVVLWKLFILRLKLLKIGARLEAGRTFLRFHFPATCPVQNDWRRLGAILNASNST